MNIFWPSLLRPLLEAARPARVIEIGAAAGRNSLRLARWCRVNGAVADIIDPAPAFDVAAFERDWAGVARVHLAPSLEVLGELPAADVVFVDGDHNWYTVFSEITLLLGPVDAPHPNPPILVFHDTAWPWARRDAYYDVSRIPAEFVQPHGMGPISPFSTGRDPNGADLGILCADVWGGPRNGVRTAIEDALAGRDGLFETCALSAFFGLTIAVPRARLNAQPELMRLLGALTAAPRLTPVIDLLEQHRLAGAQAAYALSQAFPGRLQDPPVPKTSDRPLQTALSTEVWQGFQRGMVSQRYKGRMLCLHPFDQFNYMSLIETLRPGTIFEIGSHEGGRALWMADQLRAFGIMGRVLSLDLVPPKEIDDPLVEILEGNAQNLGAVLTGARLAGLPRPWLVIEDAAHTTATSRAVLDFFDPNLRTGDRIVIEDGNTGSLAGNPEIAPPPKSPHPCGSSGVSGAARRRLPAGNRVLRPLGSQPDRQSERLVDAAVTRAAGCYLAANSRSSSPRIAPLRISGARVSC